jgi:hypothetical protein
VSCKINCLSKQGQSGSSIFIEAEKNLIEKTKKKEQMCEIDLKCTFVEVELSETVNGVKDIGAANGEAISHPTTECGRY